MNTGSSKTGIGCQWLGAWLLATSALLVYGETAPGAVPDFTIALFCLGAGAGLFWFGCGLCTRNRQRA